MMVWALHYAANDFYVHPVCWPDDNGQCACGRKTKDKTTGQLRSTPHVGNNIGKAPLINDWQKESTRDPAKILRWWRRWPNANIGGLDNERSGIFVADNDKDSGPAHALRKVFVPITRVHQSGGADFKWHTFFKRPDGLTIQAKHKTELGINTESSGQVLLPPSLHKSGARYTIVSDLPIALPPPGLIEQLQALPEEKTERKGQRQPASSSPEPGSIAADILGGLKEPRTCTEENATWIQSMLNVVPGTITRDEWLNIGRALHWLISGDPAWAETAYRMWDSFSQRFPELYNADGLATQWRSFHTEGRANAITLGTLIHLAKQHGWNEPPPPVTVQVQVESESAPAIEVKTPRFSDDHLALEFVARHRHEIRYVAAWGRWLRHGGKVWRRDETLSIYDLVRNSNRSLAGTEVAPVL